MDEKRNIGQRFLSYARPWTAAATLHLYSEPSRSAAGRPEVCGIMISSCCFAGLRVVHRGQSAAIMVFAVIHINLLQ